MLLATVDSAKMVRPQEYASYLSELVVPLALLVRKGLLVWFPSRSLLKETYALVQPKVEALGVAVYGQGVDGGHRVVEHLLDEDSVVFALMGTPRMGDPVPECLLLTRVPFAPPNALDEVRRGQVSSPAGSFVEVNVRPAALTLRSCVEKMLQSTGRRAVVIADQKVLPQKSNWGSEFLETFSDLPRATGPLGEVLSRLGHHLGRL